jgi:hypothetical protein
VWSALCTWRQGARISLLSLKIKADEFPGLGLKTGSSGLLIWTSKSPRQFLGLGLKTKQDSVCRLHHKTKRGRSARDTHQDLAACFMLKHVWLGFPVWPQDWRRNDDGCYTWHHYRGCVELKLKTDESMRRAASHTSTPILLFSMY